VTVRRTRGVRGARVIQLPAQLADLVEPAFRPERGHNRPATRARLLNDVRGQRL
jgi:hypothetical protein